MSDTRLNAVLILQEILEKKAFYSDARQRFKISEQDNAFVNMLILSSLRHLVYTKKVIKQFAKKKLPPKAALAHYALILGTTEILYLQTPDYAVINSYVEITKKALDKYVSGFVNAVLRKICTAKEQFITQDKGEFFPPEFRKLLNLSYGSKTTSKIERAAIKEPLLDLSVKQNPEELAQKLKAEILPTNTLRLQNSGNVASLYGYKKGLWWVQDFSSALPVKLLPPLTGAKILDLCAAPGGKTAQLLNLGGQVTAVDVSDVRLERLQENMQRLNLSPQNVICADALSFIDKISKGDYDIIVLDAPCSATGTLRRHPEIVHIKTLQDVEQASKFQTELLNKASQKLSSKGMLLYCTCSLSHFEGELQITTFLQNNHDFHIVKPLLPSELSELITTEGFVRILPYHLPKFGGADGFFTALLQKD